MAAVAARPVDRPAVTAQAYRVVGFAPRADERQMLGDAPRIHAAFRVQSPGRGELALAIIRTGTFVLGRIIALLELGLTSRARWR